MSPIQLQPINSLWNLWLLLSYQITWQGRGISLFCVNFLSNSVQCCPISSSIISSTKWASLPPSQPSRTPSSSGMTSNPVTSRSRANCCRTSTDHLVHDNVSQFTHKTFLHYKLPSVTCKRNTILFFPLTTCLQRQFSIIWKSLIYCFIAKRWRIKVKGVPAHAIKLCTCVNGGTDPLILTLGTTWGVNVQVCATVALNSRKGALWTHWIWSWVVPRGGLDTLEKTQVSCLRLTTHKTTHYANRAIPAPIPISYSRHYVAEQHYCPLTRSTENLCCQQSTRAIWNRERSCL